MYDRECLFPNQPWRRRLVNPDYRRGQPRRAREQLTTLPLSHRSERRLEQLTNDRVRKLALEFPTTCRQHRDPRVTRTHAGGLQQHRLTDPGRPLDQQHATLPSDAASQQRGDAVKFPATLEQAAHRGNLPRRPPNGIEAPALVTRPAGIVKS